MLPRLLLFPVIILFALTGCRDDDPCDTARPGINYTISDTTLAYLSAYEMVGEVIFRNQANEEVRLVVRPRRDTLVGYQLSAPCAGEPTRPQRVEGTSQMILLSLENPLALPKPIFLSLYEFPRPDTSAALETFSISLGNLLSGQYEAGDELFYRVSGLANAHVRLQDSLLIGNSTFYNVYSVQNLTPAPKLQVHYTMTEGIVRIADPLSSTILEYDRTE